MDRRDFLKRAAVIGPAMVATGADVNTKTRVPAWSEDEIELYSCGGIDLAYSSLDWARDKYFQRERVYPDTLAIADVQYCDMSRALAMAVFAKEKQGVELHIAIAPNLKGNRSWFVYSSKLPRAKPVGSTGCVGQ